MDSIPIRSVYVVIWDENDCLPDDYTILCHATASTRTLMYISLLQRWVLFRSIHQRFGFAPSQQIEANISGEDDLSQKESSLEFQIINLQLGLEFWIICYWTDFFELVRYRWVFCQPSWKDKKVSSDETIIIELWFFSYLGKHLAVFIALSIFER